MRATAGESFLRSDRPISRSLRTEPGGGGGVRAAWRVEPWTAVAHDSGNGIARAGQGVIGVKTQTALGSIALIVCTLATMVPSAAFAGPANHKQGPPPSFPGQPRRFRRAITSHYEKHFRSGNLRQRPAQLQAYNHRAGIRPDLRRHYLHLLPLAADYRRRRLIYRRGAGAQQPLRRAGARLCRR